MFYVTLIVTTKQKPTVDTQKIKRGKLKHTTIENHQFTKEDSKERKKGTKKLQNSKQIII